MKILRIKFQNLNSLPFGDIDLEHGPLSQAGIFAITGPTGAGKSTILDAITLALYGRAARYDNAPNPENMMSRHTGSCQAEVVFEVRGETYRAEWQLRRARGRADGNLQPPSRRIYDRQNNVLAQNVTEADRQIEELTGLNYERFLRSALLAQGQFARFLKATESQRAELLESLTGTTIYSELSALAYREATDREEALKRRKEALGSIALFTEEERAAKAAEIARFDGEIAEQTRLKEALVRRIEQGRRLAALAADEAELLRKKAALAGREAEAAPDLERLRRHRLAEPFSAALQTLDDLLERHRREAAGHDEARADAATALTRLASGLESARLLAAETGEVAAKELDQARGERETLAAQFAEAQQWLARQAADAELETVLPALVEELTELAAARRSLREAAERTEKLGKERETAVAALANLRTRQTAAEEKERESGTAAAAANAALSGLLGGRSSKAVLGDFQALEKRWIALGELRGAMEKRDAAAAEALKISDDEVRLLEELEIARAQKVTMEGEAHAQANLLELTRNNLELLEKVAGYEDQRAQLTPGEPCPLCGAPEHPFAKPGAEVSREIEEARRNLQRAKAANATAAKEAELATVLLAKTEEALQQLRKRRAQLRHEQMSGHETFETLARGLRIYTLESLNEAMEANRLARENHEKLIHAIGDAEKKKAEAEIAHVKALAEKTGAAEAVGAAQTGLARLEKQIEEARLASEKRQAEGTEHACRLAASLAPFGVTAPEPGEEARAIKALESRRQLFQNTLRTRTRLEAELARAAIRIETLSGRLEAIRAQARRIAEARQAGDPARGVPDRETVERFCREWRDLGEAETALETLRCDLARENAAVGERLKNLREVEGAASRQGTEVARRLEGSPFATVEALREARLAAGEALELESLKNDLETESQTVAAQLAQTREQALGLREAGAPEEGDLLRLETERKTGEALVLEIAGRRTTLANELEHDTRNRQARDRQAVELEEEGGRLAAWLSLRELIGSADGKKFSRFAQGLSLDILLRHANRHLRRLSGRYELRRTAGGELLLEIVDLHQAGAARPMLSLSGGESFLVSLALALGLSDLAGRNVRIDSLFIDEGFGSLDADTLDMAVSALDTLRLANKTVGIISHVELLKERIPVQIRVEKQAGGLSLLRLPE